jgi:hypothetical protein
MAPGEEALNSNIPRTMTKCSERHKEGREMRKRKRKHNNADIERRLQFVIQEARQDEPLYDQCVDISLRVISNYLCIGEDGQSSAIYKKSRFRSEKAHQLHLAGDITAKLWNEHQEELNLVWKWIVENKGTITPTAILDRMNRWPMVVITREENAQIPRTETDPKARYAHIVVLECSENGEWLKRAID